MRRKKILCLPRLCDRKGDCSKKWFVEMSQRNPKTDEMARRRFETFGKTNINHLTTAEERRNLAQKLIDDLNAKLKAGWTIFSDQDRYVYEDQLQYVHQAQVYKEQVESNASSTINIDIQCFIKQ
jgi:esterase/lipase